MAKDIRNYEVRFSATGQAEVTTTVQGVNKAFKVLDAQIKNSFDTSSLTAMNKVLDAQKQKLAILTDQLKEQRSQLDQLEAGSDAWIAQTKAIAKTQSQITKLNSNIEKTNATINKLGAEANPTFGQKLKQQVDLVQKPIDSLAGGFDKMVSTVVKGAGAIAGVGIGALISGGINQAAESYSNFNSLQATFDFAGRTKKDFESAKTFIQDYAAQTEFSANDITQAWNQMGLDGSKASKELISGLGGITQAYKEPAVAMKQLLPQMSQIQTAGKLTYEDWSVMTDYLGKDVVNALEKTMREAGAFSGDFRTAMSNGEISAEELNDAIRKVGNDPSLQEQAKQVGTLSGAFGAAGDDIAIAMEPIANQVIPMMVDAVTSAGNAIADFVRYIQTLSSAQWAQIIGGITGFVAAAATILTLAKIVTVIQNFQNGIGALSAAFTFLTSPIGLIIAAIGLLVGAFVTAYTSSETFRNIVNGAFQAAGNVINTVVSTIINVVNSLGINWGQVWNTMVSVVSSVVGTVGSVVGSIVNFIIDLYNQIATYIGQINVNWSQVWQNISTIISVVFAPIQAVIVSVLSYITGYIGGFLSGIASEWSNVWNGIAQVVQGVVQTISGIVQVIVSVVTGVVNTVGSLLRGDFSGAWNSAKDMVSGVTQGIGNIIGGLVDVISGSVDAIVSAAKGIGKGIFNGIIDGLAGLGKAIGDAVMGAIDSIGDVAGKVISKVTGKSSFNSSLTTSQISKLQAAELPAYGAFASHRDVMANPTRSFGDIVVNITQPVNNGRQLAREFMNEIARTESFN